VKAVLQRVSRAEVRVGGERVASIGPGLLVLLCVLKGDDEDRARGLARRVAEWRCFPDERDRMNRSLLEQGGEALVVSQITLAADGLKGRRPALDSAELPGRARELCQVFRAFLEELGVPCQSGVFGARMAVELVNDGPVTFFLEEPAERRS
jgi:D-tyrosyl-tRNA(Tyr) deacylase